MTVDEYISIVEKQEELLRFSHFTREDVWELGNEIVSIILEHKLPMCVAIRLRDGFTLFQYYGRNTTLFHNTWMNRKFNIVRELEVSSLLNNLRLQKNRQSLEDTGFDSANYAASGGGFPIRVKDVGLIGVIMASGTNHLHEHDTLVEGISRILKVQTPRIPEGVHIIDTPVSSR